MNMNFRLLAKELYRRLMKDREMRTHGEIKGLIHAHM